MPTYGWQSKRYLFGQNLTGEVDDAVQSGFPSRLLGMTSYFLGGTDRIKLVARFGGSAELTLLDHTNGSPPSVYLLDQEVDLLPIANLMPADPATWYLSFRLELETDYRDPTPESPDWPFVANSDVSFYLYRDLLTQSVEIRQDPIDTNRDRGGNLLTTTVPEYLPIKQVQAVFYFAGGGEKLRVATAISDSTGLIRTALPAGTYDVEFYGGGILQSEWLYGYTVGAGDTLTPWLGRSTAGISQAAEFSAIRTAFSTLYWPGYIVAEDFAPERAAYRDEAAETNAYGNNYAIQRFGRVFAGRSYVEFVGLAVDPPPK